jgi:hypothetical protein
MATIGAPATARPATSQQQMLPVGDARELPLEEGWMMWLRAVAQSKPANPAGRSLRAMRSIASQGPKA